MVVNGGQQGHVFLAVFSPLYFLTTGFGTKALVRPVVRVLEFKGSITSGARGGIGSGAIV
jgi:hypothetical protein